MAIPKIWLMEGQWSDRADDHSSVRPALTVLEDLRLAKVARRHVNREDDLVDELRQWGLKRNDSYGVGYLALHGSPSSVYVRSERITLQHLARRLSEIDVDLHGRVLHLGSCAVLRSTAGAQELLDATGLSLITGYTRDVEWVESMALDLLLMNALGRYTRHGDAVRRVRTKYDTLAKHLGFTVVTCKG